MIVGLIRSIQRLSTRQINWSRPRRRPVLLIDPSGIDLLSQFIAFEDIEILDFEETNIWILIRTILRLRVTTSAYVITYIESIQPKVVLTFIDNNINFYRLKRMSPHTRFVVIQNGLRNNFSREKNIGFLSHLDSASKSERLSATMICTFGEAASGQYSKYIDAMTNTIGSLKNNLYEKHSKEQRFDINFISQHPPSSIRDEPGRVYFGQDSVSFESFYKIEFEVVKFLGDYCRQHNLRLAVSGKRENGFGTEREFFLSALGPNPAEFIPRDSNFSTYDTLSATGVIVTIDSTMGYEFLSRGQRVAFFSSRINSADPDLASTIKDTNFGFPLQLEDSGPFWSNTGGVLEYERILDHLRAVGDEEWATEIAPYNESLMAYQPGNPVFKKLLLDLGITLIDGVKSDA